MSNNNPKRQYDADFKRNTAELYLSVTHSLSKLNEELDIPEST